MNKCPEHSNMVAYVCFCFSLGSRKGFLVTKGIDGTYYSFFSITFIDEKYKKINLKISILSAVINQTKPIHIISYFMVHSLPLHIFITFFLKQNRIKQNKHAICLNNYSDKFASLCLLF